MVYLSPVSPVFHTIVTVSNWTQKSIHSTILDIHVLKAEHLTLRLIKLFGKNKNGRGLIPDRGSCPLSTQLTEDRLRHASGPVHRSL